MTVFPTSSSKALQCVCIVNLNRIHYVAYTYSYFWNWNYIDKKNQWKNQQRGGE